MQKDDSCPPAKGAYPSDCELTQALLERARARQADPVRSQAWIACLAQARAVRLLLLDVDGVLTDGTIIYTENGGEIKAFHTRDGMGLRLLRETGVEIGLITARQSAAVTRRAQDLGLTHVYQKAGNKLAIFERLLAELGLAPAEVAYLGDDWLDLPLITRVGLAAAVADAAPEVRQRAHYVTELPGGRGAVRELCDLLIEAKGMRQSLLARYIAGNDNR